MFNRKKALERRAAIAAEIQGVRDLLAKDGRGITAEEQAHVDKLRAESGNLKTQLDLDDEASGITAGMGQQTNIPPFLQNAGNDGASAVQHFARHGRLKVRFSEDAKLNAQLAYDCGKFALAIMLPPEEAACVAARQYCADRNIPIRSAHSSGDNSKGGFLVPTQFENAVIDLRESRGIFRQKARNRPIGGGEWNQPKRTGGLQAYWLGDTQGAIESQKSWGNIQLRAKELVGLALYAITLEEDAVISIGQDFVSELAYAFAVAEDEAGFNGDGTSSYGGIVGLKNALKAGSKVTATGHTSVTALTVNDFIACIAALPQYSGMQAEWYVHSSVWATSMLAIAMAGGGNTVAQFEGGARQMFLGYPVNFVQCMDKVLTTDSGKIKAYLGDLSMASTVGTTRGFSVASDRSLYFLQRQVAVMGVQRADISVHEVGTATEAGPMVALVTG
ncbi:MAG: phage major capsid protein [Gemmataceae bacterium]